MVRLKVYQVVKDKATNIDFNSYMVRLKAEVVGKEKETSVFQFLHGAIKSEQDLGVFDIRDKDFNSYMVRLKAKAYLHEAQPYFNFNSYMVRLKEI